MRTHPPVWHTTRNAAHIELTAGCSNNGLVRLIRLVRLGLAALPLQQGMVGGSQKQACACCWPGDSAAVASGISLRAAARLEGARDPQSCRSGSPVQSGIGPMIPAYDFSPVGEGVTFLPKGNREGSCARSRLHDSTDLECRGPVS